MFQEAGEKAAQEFLAELREQPQSEFDVIDHSAVALAYEEAEAKAQEEFFHQNGVTCTPHVRKTPTSDGDALDGDKVEVEVARNHRKVWGGHSIDQDEFPTDIIKESLATCQKHNEKFEAARQRLASVMDVHGAALVPVIGDGNCQFRALAEQLYGDEQRHREARSLAVRQLRAKDSWYRPFAPNAPEESFAKYVTRMARDGQWGDECSLQAMSDVTHRAIYVFTEASMKAHEVVPVQGAAVGTPLYLSLITDPAHYDAARVD
jgi:hypothetical protein